VKHIPSIIISEFRRFSGSCSYESMSLFFVINPPAASEPELVSDTWSTDQFTALGIRREKLLCLPVCWGFTVLVYCGMEKNCCSRPAAAWFVPTGKSWVITGLRCGLNVKTRKSHTVPVYPWAPTLRYVGWVTGILEDPFALASWCLINISLDLMWIEVNALKLTTISSKLIKILGHV
jgi:hypothetical protein